MSLKNLSFSEHLPSDRLHNTSRRVTILWGLIFILLFIVMGFALVQSVNPFDGDDSPLLEAGHLTGMMGQLLLESFLFAMVPGVFVTIMRLEHLRGHIGEKRPASRPMAVRYLSPFTRYSLTVLFYGTVFSIFPVSRVDDVNRPTKVFH